MLLTTTPNGKERESKASGSLLIFKKLLNPSESNCNECDDQDIIPNEKNDISGNAIAAVKRGWCVIGSAFILNALIFTKYIK
jgi:hypothetical protein